MKSPVHRQILVAALLVALLAGVVLAGCGSSDDDIPPPPDYAKKLAGSPPPLAALHEQGDELLDGGRDAYDARIAELKGFPIVVNVWASWCGPCRNEFPLIQQAAAEYGKEVAFLGVNVEDDKELAGNFLADYPVPFPSYFDQKAELADDLGATHGYPATFFYDENGEMVGEKHGEFPDQETLDQYIQDYAFGGQSG